MLDNLKTDATVKDAGDFLGGVSTLDTGLYPMAISMAYLDTSKGGAMSLNLSFSGQSGTQLKQTLWMTSGTAKGCKNTYEDRQGNKQYLPGFNQANALCLLTIRKEVAEAAAGAETKYVNVWNNELQKEVPTEKQVITSLLGEQVILGVFKQIVDKNVKDASGQYVPSGETREENEIDKIFRSKDGLTVVEIKAEETVAVFKDKWLEKNKGTVRNKSKKVVGTRSTATTTPEAPTETKNLFG